MPTKPPFDPKVHLLDPSKASEDPYRFSNNKPERRGSGDSEDDDEALARRLQHQILEEEMRAEDSRRKSRKKKETHNQRTQEDDDMELARRLQFGEADPDPGLMHFEERQRQTGITDQMEYARSLQQQALRDVGSNSPTPRDSSSRSKKSSRRTSSGGSSTRSKGSSSSRSKKSSRSKTSGSSRHKGSSRPEEHDDAALAQWMAESGESLRDFDSGTLPPVNPAPRSTPGAHHVSYPAGMPRELAGRGHSTSSRKHRKEKQYDSRHKSPAHSPKPVQGQVVTAELVPDQDADPPGMGLPPSMMDMGAAVNPDVSRSTAKKSKKKERGILGFGRKSKTAAAAAPAAIPPMSRILSPEPKMPERPLVIPPPLTATPGPVPYSIQASRTVQVPTAPTPSLQKKKAMSLPTRNPKTHICDECQKPANNYVSALDKKYHPDCFRCMGCHKVIEINGPFAYMEEGGEKHPLHKECFAELYGVKCAVCRKSIPAGPDGKVSFVKHPFFDTEQMCPSHAANPGRRCTGCHRFEPEDEPFADLGDLGRVVCYACCRTVVVDSSDAEPLWGQVIEFLENELQLPIWPDLREVPILVVGYKALNDQMKQAGGAHIGASQTMTRGVCLTEHQSGRKVQVSNRKFNKDKQSFEDADAHQNGFTFFQVPDAQKVNPDSSVTCILCLSGLPRDLTASVLAHEAAHAWIKLHPRYDVDNPLPPQVEEGCCQLIALLFLTDGLEPASDEKTDDGPSEEKLRQYFKFSIETDKNEIYGEGYRKAARVYSAIGIEALMAHVVLYKEFPHI